MKLCKYCWNPVGEQCICSESHKRMVYERTRKDYDWQRSCIDNRDIELSKEEAQKNRANYFGTPNGEYDEVVLWPSVEVDDSIWEIIREFNTKGYDTISCCGGHWGEEKTNAPSISIKFKNVIPLNGVELPEEFSLIEQGKKLFLLDEVVTGSISYTSPTYEKINRGEIKYDSKSKEELNSNILLDLESARKKLLDFATLLSKLEKERV